MDYGFKSYIIVKKKKILNSDVFLLDEIDARIVLL